MDTAEGFRGTGTRIRTRRETVSRIPEGRTSSLVFGKDVLVPDPSMPDTSCWFIWECTAGRNRTSVRYVLTLWMHPCVRWTVRCHFEILLMIDRNYFHSSPAARRRFRGWKIWKSIRDRTQGSDRTLASIGVARKRSVTAAIVRNIRGHTTTR